MSSLFLLRIKFLEGFRVLLIKTDVWVFKCRERYARGSSINHVTLLGGGGGLDKCYGPPRGGGGVNARVTWRQKCDILKLFVVYYFFAEIYVPLSLEARFAPRAHHLKYCGGRYYSDRRTAESLNPDCTLVRYANCVISPIFDAFS